MSNTITCFINRDGNVVIGSGVGVDQRKEFQFDLEQRQIVGSQLGQWPFTTEQSDYKAVHDFFKQNVGTPEKLMEFVKEASLSKLELAKLLNRTVRGFYLNVCAGIEKGITEACTAQNDPCLEGGCALEGQICLNACLTANELYYKQCANVWLELFKNPNNRIGKWRS